MGKTHRKISNNAPVDKPDISVFTTPSIIKERFDDKPQYKIVGHARVSKSGNALSLKIDEGLIPRYFVISKHNLTDLFIGKETVIQIREYDGIRKSDDFLNRKSDDFQINKEVEQNGN